MFEHAAQRIERSDQYRGTAAQNDKAENSFTVPFTTSENDFFLRQQTDQCNKPDQHRRHL